VIESLIGLNRPDMTIWLVARLKTFDEFVDRFSDDASSGEVETRSLLLGALGNTSPTDRYRIANYLLDRGARGDAIGPDGSGSLSVLLGQVSNDWGEVLSLCRRLIDNGADVNRLDERNRLPIQWIIAAKATDAELAPLYDLWFDQPILDLQTANDRGCSPLDLARKVPYRSELVARMESRLRASARQ
jgi:hypothetical protein